MIYYEGNGSWEDIFIVKGNVRVISSRANLLKNNAEIWELEKVRGDTLKRKNQLWSKHFG